MKQFMEMLKTATAAAHRGLENTAISKKIMSSSVDRETYSNYLSRIYDMHDAIEVSVGETIRPVIQDIELRSKAEFIRQDLVSLEKDVPEKNIFLNEEYENNLNFNLGLMYVAEGSILGGQFILKNIVSVLGADIPCQFLNLYGRSTGTLWKTFCAQLNNYQRNLTINEREEIINGAVYGFERARFILN